MRNLSGGCLNLSISTISDITVDSAQNNIENHQNFNVVNESDNFSRGAQNNVNIGTAENVQVGDVVNNFYVIPSSRNNSEGSFVFFY